MNKLFGWFSDFFRKQEIIETHSEILHNIETVTAEARALRKSFPIGRTVGHQRLRKDVRYGRH